MAFNRVFKRHHRVPPGVFRQRESRERELKIVAGYSAGAAVFSDPMIGNGTSLGALSLAPSTDPSCGESDPVCVAQGLGFVPAADNVVVDQHFDERGRFARLVRALAVTNERTGWGVSANCALYVDLLARTAEVVGNPGDATVTIVGRDGAGPNHEHAGPPFLGDSYTISVLGTGDVYALPDAAHPHGVERARLSAAGSSEGLARRRAASAIQIRRGPY